MAKNVSTPDISLVKNAPIAELVLNRPPAKNAISHAMWRAIPGLVGEAASDPAIRVLVIHGGDTASFSAGADIAELAKIADTPEAADHFHEQMRIALETLARFPGPVIARIDGPCIGAGMALALACDLRFAANTARFGVTPAKLGLTYPLADTRALVALIGPARAKDLIFSSRLIDADEALRLGLVERVLPEHELIDYTQSYVQQLCERSAHTQRAMKTMINAMGDHDPVLSLQSQDVFIESFSITDFKEGVLAFSQKRKPDFS
ncbi:MAG: enoyl-CoA hydratase/isomerase family protein [Robiginitomaculum sp.]|nr:enoyl-CoA hydratase/isomerase family protein [Robiginitomaculum sp.]